MTPNTDRTLRSPRRLTQAVIALAYLFFSLEFLVDAVVFVEWFFHGLVALALLRLRARRKDIPRPYRSPLYPLAPTVYLVAAVLVVGHSLRYEADLRQVGLYILSAGTVAYVVWNWVLSRRGIGQS